MDTNKKIRTSLQRTYIDFQTWARENNIYHHFIKLEDYIYGFVLRSPFGNYFIIINKNLTLELQKEIYCHEVEHIIYDMPEESFRIGMDMQYTKLERTRGGIAAELMKAYASNGGKFF